MTVGKRFILYLTKKNWTREFLGSLKKDVQSDFENFRKFKMADPIWGLKNVLFYIPIKNWARRFSGLLKRDVQSNFENFGKSKMAIQ